MKLLKLVATFCFVALFFPTQAQLELQVCATPSRDSWEWPSNNTWFVAQFSGGLIPGGEIITFDGGFSTTPATQPMAVYEGVTAASDDLGNLIYLCNGKYVWDASGTITSTDIKEGDEAGGQDPTTPGSKQIGSASQGVMSVRHPLTPKDYYIVSVGDVIGGANPGLSYNVINEKGVEIQGNVNLGMKACEGIAATFHENGVDIWVSVLEYGAPNLYSYLLTCDGFVDPPVISNNGDARTGDAGRGGLAFSHKGDQFVACFPTGWPNADKQVSLYDFNTKTGVFSNRNNIGPTAFVLGPYDAVWSKDDSEIIVAKGNGGTVNSVNVATGALTKGLGGIGGGSHTVEIGRDGNYYFNGGDGLWQWSGSGAAVKVDDATGWGLPTIYIPPAEEPDIQEVGPFCDTSSAVDLHTYWVCSGYSAEDTLYQRHLYSGPGITDAKVGTFDPQVAGIGLHEIIFEYCDVNDTIWIDVAFCPSCRSELKDVSPRFCVGNDYMLDTLIEESSQIGVWTIDSFPSSPSTDGILVEGTDTMFDVTDLTSRYGVYKVLLTVTDAGKTCYDSVYITVDSLPKPDLGIDSTICIGDAAIDFDAGAWDAYDWSSGETVQVISKDAPGEYIVEITDVNGCKGKDTVELFHDTLPVPNLGPDTAICLGDPAVVFDAGVWDAYLWTPNSETTQTISNDVAGEYGIEVTDGNGCKGTDSILLTVNVRPTVDLGLDQEICENDPSITFDAQNVGSTYAWFGTTDSTQTIQRDSAGTYTVEITDVNGCKDTNDVVLTVFPLPTVDLGNDTTICIDAPAVVFDAMNTGATYLWTSGGETTQDITTNIGGEYIVQVEDANGCSDTDTVVLNISQLPIVDLGVDLEICQIAPAVTIDALNDSATYLWSTAETTKTIDIHDQGEYSVIVTDTNGCISYDTLLLDVNQMPVVSMNDTSICDGDPAVTFDAGAGFTTYTWKSGESTQSIQKDVAGIYIVDFVDANSCAGSDTVELTINALPVPDLGVDQTICDGAAAVSFTPGNFDAYSWSSTETTSSISKSVAGIYTVEVTDTKLCKATDDVELIVIDLPNPDVILGGPMCPGMSQTLDASIYDNGNGPYTYAWHNGSTGSSYISTGAESIWVDITDQYNCTGRDLASVSINAALIVSVVGSPLIELCEGEDTDLVPNYKAIDGYNFSWSSGQTTDVINVTVSGTYDVHVDNGLGCEGDGTIDVIVHPDPIVVPGSAAVCDGIPASIGDNQGGGFDYSWSSGEITADISVLTGGTYTLTITDKATGCVDSDDFDVTIHSNPTPDLGPNILVCTGIPVQLSDISGQDIASQSWNSGETSATINPTTDGTYTVTVTTPHGCVGTSSADVEFIPIPTVNLGPDINMCDGETAVVDAGNDGLSISWNSGETTPTITVNSTFTHIVTVSDNGCSAYDTIDVNVVALPVSEIDHSLANQSYCFPEMSGRGVDIVAGTSSVYDYLWGTGETTPTISPTVAGTYSVLISVGNCSITDYIRLVEFCPSTLFIPNSFTPDGDGINDSFNASGTYIEDYEMYIYNRWGEMIYKSESLTQDWDGQYKGKDVQVDVYVYKLYYSVNHPDGNPRKETKVGTVTVMR